MGEGTGQKVKMTVGRVSQCVGMRAGSLGGVGGGGGRSVV